MIAVVVDDIKSEPDLKDARFVVLVNTKKRATKAFTKLKKSLDKYVEIKLGGKVEMSPSEVMDFFAWIGMWFAEYKERVIVFCGDKQVVYAKGV